MTGKAARLNNFHDLPLAEDFTEADLQDWIATGGIVQQGENAVINLGTDNTIQLDSVLVTDLHANNFAVHLGILV